jgi:hypothetical protein
VSDCERCNDLKYRAEQWARYNNPKEHPQKYGADHGVRRMLGDLADRFVEAAQDGIDDEAFCDLIDREFLFGAWRSEMEPRNPDMLRNLRGLIVNLARRVEERES